MMTHPTKQEIVYNEIVDKIINNKYESGMVLTEDMLCKDLKVSRTPVREAVRRLSADGFLQVTPGTGMVVTKIGLEDMLEIYELREGLERLATKLFIQKKDSISIEKLTNCFKQQEIAYKNQDETLFMKYDMEFHHIIYSGAHNSRLSAALDNIYKQISRLAISVQNDKLLQEMAINDHRKICTAILEDNTEAALSAIENHIYSVKGYQLKKYYHL